MNAPSNDSAPEPRYDIAGVSYAIASLGYPDGPDLSPDDKKVRELVTDGGFAAWLKSLIEITTDHESPNYQPDSVEASEKAEFDAEMEWRATKTLETLTDKQRDSLMAEVEAEFSSDVWAEISQLMPLGGDDDDNEERDEEYVEEPNEEKGISNEHLAQIPPSNELHSIRSNPDPPSPDPELLIKSMQYVSVLAQLFNCTIDLMFCEFNLSHYTRLDVDEENFFTGDGFSMSDYVPISPSDLIELKELDPRSMLHQIQTISKGRHCIVTTRGKAAWAERVFYPHT